MILGGDAGGGGEEREEKDRAVKVTVRVTVNKRVMARGGNNSTTTQVPDICLVGVLRPGSIKRHIMMATDVLRCALLATLYCCPM